MEVSYRPLKHLLIDRGLKLGDLRDPAVAGLNSSTVTRIDRDEYVSLQTIELICSSLSCRIEDVVEFVSVDIKETNT